VALLLLATSPSLPMAWDEGDALDRADAIREWFASWASPRGEVSPRKASPIRKGWPFTTTREGHPAFYGLVIAAGRAIAPDFLDPLSRYRLGPILLFALACGTVTAKLSQRWGTFAAIAAVLAILLQPRLFAHAHFASFDSPLTACWMLTWAALPFGAERRCSASHATQHRFHASALVCGVCLGLTMGCKASGWLAVIPVAVSQLLTYRRRFLLPLVAVLAIADATFIAVNPPLWHTPLAGFAHFFYLNLHRSAQPGLNISILFAGRMYNLDYPLPIYNTFLWTMIAVPLPLLAFFAAGLVFLLASRSHRRWGAVLILFWITLVLARAIPGTPPHDGIRQFLPAFAILGIIAGIGLSTVLRWSRMLIRRRAIYAIPREIFIRLCRRSPFQAWPGESPSSNASLSCPIHPHHDRLFRQGQQILTNCISLAILIFYCLPAYSVYIYTPQWLSYYNVLIGGLSGAERAGFEATYYWDALDWEVMEWLNHQAGHGRSVYLSTYPQWNLRRLQEWRWAVWKDASRPEDAAWYVVQNRPSGWTTTDGRLYQRGQAAFEKRIRRLGSSSPPLLKVFSRDEFLRWRATQAVLASPGVDP